MQYQRTKSRLLDDTYGMIIYLSCLDHNLCIKHSFHSTNINKGIMKRRQQFHHDYHPQQLSSSHETMEHSRTQIDPLAPSPYHEHDNTMDDDMSSENDNIDVDDGDEVSTEEYDNNNDMNPEDLY